MSTSNSNHNNKPAPPGAGTPSSYTRFIPREEVGAVKAWNPQTFEPQPAAAMDDLGARKPTLAERAAAEMRSSSLKSHPHAAHHAPQAMGTPEGKPAVRPQAAASAQAGAQAAQRAAAAQRAQPGMHAGVQPGAANGAARPVRRPIVGGMPGQAEAEEQAAAEAEAAAAAPGPNIEEMVDQARQSGYQDGYRNGLAALETYKQTQAAQMAAYMSDQIGTLAADFHHRLESLEQQLAGRIAGVALELARQAVRSELQLRPDVVVDVAEQALGALLASARQIVLRLNPEDQALAQAELSEMLAARGARIVPDAAIARGGCVVESDIAIVDATVEARWDRAAASMGHDAPWNGGREALESTELRLSEAEGTLEDWPATETEAAGHMLDLPLEGDA